MDQIILQFSADTAGIVEVATAMHKLGQITDAQLKEITELSKKGADSFKKQTAEINKETSALGKLNQNLKQTTQALAGGAVKQGTEQMAKFGKEVTKVASESTRLTTELRNLKNQLAGLDEGSAEFQRIAIEAAKLEDQIGDVRERIRVMASDTFAIDAVVDGVRGMTAAFTVAQSAAALFGEENEDLNKALLKVQAATGLLVGVQEIANQVTGQGAAKLAILSGAQKIYTFVTGAATAAAKAFRAAIVATGVGAAIAALGAIIAYWDDISAAIFGAKKSAEEYAKEQEEAGRRALAFQNSLKKGITDAAGLASKSTAELKDEVSRLNAELDKIPKEGLTLVVNGQQIKQNMEAARKNIKDQIAEIQKELDTRDQIKVKVDPNIEFDPDERLSNLAGYTVKQKEILDEGLKKVGEILSEDAEIPIKGKIDIPEFELTEESKVRLGEQIKDAFGDDEVRQSAIQGAQEIFDAIFQISSERRAADTEAQLAALDELREAELSNKRLTDDQRAAIEEKYRRKEAKVKEDQYKANKKAAIAQAIINGALAVTNIIATTPKFDFGAATYALLALNAVSTAASVATIAAQPIPKFRKGKIGIEGPGTETSDSIPAYLSAGESVLSAAATRMFRPELEMMNRLKNPFALDRFTMPEVVKVDAGKVGAQRMDTDSLVEELREVKRAIKASRTNITVTDGHTVIEKGGNQKTYLNKYM